MKKILSTITCAAILGFTGTASAFLFEMGADSTVTGPALTDPGLVMEFKINADLGSYLFDVAEGASSGSFLFATFWTNEGTINWGEDNVPQSLTANVDFDSPDLLGTVNGSSNGDRDLIGFWSGWNISWTSPVTIDYGNGGSFELSLSEASAGNDWFHGPDGVSANVYATITNQNDPTAPVPEPSTMLLFGAGLAGLVGYSRRRQKK